jgi:hypothetical protein
MTLLGWLLLFYCAATLHARPCDGRRVATFCLHPDGTWTEYPATPADVLGPPALVLAGLPLIFGLAHLGARLGMLARGHAPSRSVEDVDASAIGGGLYQSRDGTRFIEFRDRSEWMRTGDGWTAMVTNGSATTNTFGVAIGARKVDSSNGPSPEQFDALWTAVLAARGCTEPN